MPRWRVLSMIGRAFSDFAPLSLSFCACVMVGASAVLSRKLRAKVRACNAPALALSMRAKLRRNLTGALLQSVCALAGVCTMPTICQSMAAQGQAIAPPAVLACLIWRA